MKMKMSVFFRILEFVCRIGLGTLFVYSALAKISDPDEFAYSVSRYDLLPGFVVGIFALTMPMLELLAGLSMLFTKWLRESALLVAVMMAMFIVALAQALARGLEISCGCFGVPNVGGRKEILMALVRDVVLIIPAVWLMFRQNGLIEPLGRMPKVWRAIVLCGVGILLAIWVAKDTAITGEFATGLVPETDGSAEVGLVVSTGPIRPGELNSDFEGVRAKAEREQRPMVLILVSEGCRYCTRLEKCIAGETFRLWREDRAPLMAFVRDHSPLYSPETVKASQDFVHGIKKDIKGFPYICVYWPHGSVTNSVAFSGYRGIMGEQKNKLLVMDLMSALDSALGEQYTRKLKTVDSILKSATVRISAKAERSRGTVTIIPKNGLLPAGGKVTLFARPNEGYVFLDWRRPDGSLASFASHLVVSDDMPSGCYTARFKRPSQCLPPELPSPAETTLCVRVNKPVSYAINIPDACRPVSFQTSRNLPYGMTLDLRNGIIAGAPHFLGTNTVKIAVIGNDLNRTEKTMLLTIIATDDETSADDTSSNVDEKKTP